MGLFGGWGFAVAGNFQIFFPVIFTGDLRLFIGFISVLMEVFLVTGNFSPCPRFGFVLSNADIEFLAITIILEKHSFTLLAAAEWLLFARILRYEK